MNIIHMTNHDVFRNSIKYCFHLLKFVNKNQCKKCGDSCVKDPYITYRNNSYYGDLHKYLNDRNKLNGSYNEKNR